MMGRRRAHLAAQQDCAASPQCLIDAGADPRIRDGAGQTIFHRAATRCAQDALVIIARSIPVQSINDRNFVGNTPLLCALDARPPPPLSEQLSTIKFLLEHGADMDLTNQRGETAQKIAAKRGLRAVLELLEARKAYSANHGLQTKRAVRAPSMDSKAADDEKQPLVLEPAMTLSDASNQPEHLEAGEDSQPVLRDSVPDPAAVEAVSQIAKEKQSIPALQIDLGDLYLELDQPSHEQTADPE
eukprot:m.736845 g.736845  ORF g.736845 m.736845 type:complete len:243 (+) comp58901_c0_seq9:564-1292(+)